MARQNNFVPKEKLSAKELQEKPNVTTKKAGKETFYVMKHPDGGITLYDSEGYPLRYESNGRFEISTFSDGSPKIQHIGNATTVMGKKEIVKTHTTTYGFDEYGNLHSVDICQSDENGNLHPVTPIDTSTKNGWCGEPEARI